MASIIEGKLVMDRLQHIFEVIAKDGFANNTLQEINNYIKDIQNGKEDFYRFNLSEHAGFCTAGAPLIGATIIACYATASFTAGSDAESSQGGSPANWQIDTRQEQLIEKWAKEANLWVEDSERILIDEYGPMIAQGAEAKVYYREGDTSVIKERASIYSTTLKALDAIVLHNNLFPETSMRVIGFTRDRDGLFRIILTQPYINCLRLATKTEIDDMVASKGFVDNRNGEGVNYISDRLALEDMHPANVFIDVLTEKPICIDCIVKFTNPSK